MARTFTSGCSEATLTVRDDGRFEVDGAAPTRKWPKAMEQHRNVINLVAAEYQISPAIIAAFVCHESEGKANIRGGDGEYGLMQIMPGTWRNITGSLPTDEEGFDPLTNVMVGSKLVADLLKKYDGNILRTGAAYNAGSPRCGIWKGCGKASRWNLATACGYLDDLIACHNAAVDDGFAVAPPPKGADGVGASSGSSGAGTVAAALLGIGAVVAGAFWLRSR